MNLLPMLLCMLLAMGTRAYGADGYVKLYTPYTKISVPPGESINYNVDIINNSDATQSATLRIQGLPRSWKYELKAGGFTVSDAGSIHEMRAHGMGDMYDVAVLALKAGLNMDLGSEAYTTQLRRALDEGRVSEADIDLACRRIHRYDFGGGIPQPGDLHVGPPDPRVGGILRIPVPPVVTAGGVIRIQTARSYGRALKNRSMNIVPLKIGFICNRRTADEHVGPIPAVIAVHKQRKTVIVVFQILSNSQPQLFLIGDAPDGPGAFPRLIQRRQQQGCEDSNDCHNN